MKNFHNSIEKASYGKKNPINKNFPTFKIHLFGQRQKSRESEKFDWQFRSFFWLQLFREFDSQKKSKLKAKEQKILSQNSTNTVLDWGELPKCGPFENHLFSIDSLDFPESDQSNPRNPQWILNDPQIQLITLIINRVNNKENQQRNENLRTLPCYRFFSPIQTLLDD
jgi:hypothetical protein